MANIMLTDVCNLNCPYCFANEFVNKDSTEISIDSYKKAIDFIVGDGSEDCIGLIGGEPTVHSKFEELLRIAIRDERIKFIVVYTNGILIDKYVDLLTNRKVRLLINCNPPENIGETKFKRLKNNLDIFINRHCFDDITLGINMYKPDFEYNYIIDLLKEFGQKKVRVSITVPNFDSDRNTDAHSYFIKMKPQVFSFFDELLTENIIPYFDCNKLPSCLINDLEIEHFRQYYKKEYIRDNIGKYNISSFIVKCSPVIDIRQDLTAVRCFGLSQVTKENISDFSSITALRNHYLRTIDAYAYNSTYSSKCISCSKRRDLECNGGCLAFKINEILAIRNFAEQRMKKQFSIEGE